MFGKSQLLLLLFPVIVKILYLINSSEILDNEIYEWLYHQMTIEPVIFNDVLVIDFIIKLLEFYQYGF